MAAGYSGTPLAKKLGYKPGCRACVTGAPAAYRQLLAPLPEDVAFSARAGKSTDLVHMFVPQRVDLAAQLGRCRQTLKPDAAVWVSWPKKASKVATDITEDVIRATALPLGFVDIKVCAVDETWSGLKLVLRKELRAK
jgi:hypothetical protein